MTDKEFNKLVKKTFAQLDKDMKAKRALPVMYIGLRWDVIKDMVKRAK